MQNMAVDSLIENIKTKIIIKFHFINFMIYLARVANSMVIFSASYAVNIVIQCLSQMYSSSGGCGGRSPLGRLHGVRL